MSTKTEYLQKYVGVKVKRKKLQKKSKVATLQPRIHIIDDDINVITSAQDPFPESEEELGEEAPQIADIIDERPKDIKIHHTKWKTIDSTTESNQRKRLDSDSDLSPPRHQLTTDNISKNNYKHSQEQKSDNDLSPPHSSSKHSGQQKRVLINDMVQPTKHESNQRKRLDSDSDFSPPRHQLTTDKISRNNYKQSQEQKSDSDLSPPRSSSKHSGQQKRVLINDIVQPTKHESNQQKRLDSDSDVSPPRHQSAAHHISRTRYKQSQERKSDSDLSPPRLSSKNNDLPKKILTNDMISPTKNKTLQKRHQDSDSDLSPLRHQLHAGEISTNHRKRSQETSSDSDFSPPRSSSKYDGSKKKNIALSSRKNGSMTSHKSTKSEMMSTEKPKRILQKQGKAFAVVQQTEEKQHEDNIDKSLCNNKHPSRSEDSHNSSLGGNDLWVPELFKPLARYKDDPELDNYLKKQEKSGDPMLAYIRSKNKKEPNNQNAPMYKGPPPPPNRFDIKPGYRWDGVDRSNGFEKRYFDLQAKKKSQADLAYKWSVENM